MGQINLDYNKYKGIGFKKDIREFLIFLILLYFINILLVII